MGKENENRVCISTDIKLLDQAFDYKYLDILAALLHCSH